MALRNLPSDVTIEILSRLPVKTLSRFKCVSKTFHNLISNDTVFRKKHLYHQSRSKKVILKSPETAYSCPVFSLSPRGDFCDEMVDLILPVKGEDYCTQVKFHNSCNGLFCISMMPGRDVIIWNPTTRSARRIQGCHLQNPIGYSLAYDSRSDVYKLLGISEEGNNTYGLCFYSSQTRMWRRIEDYSSSSRPHYVNFKSNPTIVNGAFHWLGSNEPRFRTPHVIVSLDISDETYGTLALPQDICANYSNGPTALLYELKDKLCVFFVHNSKLCSDLWVMNEYGVVGSMTRMFRITCFDLSSPDLFFQPLYVLEDNTIVIYRVGQAFLFKDTRVLRNAIVGGSFDHTSSVAYVYSESLISPHTQLGKAFNEEIIPKNGPSTMMKSCGQHSSHTLQHNSEIVATTSRRKQAVTKKRWQILCWCKSF